LAVWNRLLIRECFWYFRYCYRIFNIWKQMIENCFSNCARVKIK
jgi:hypothetical protein